MSVQFGLGLFTGQIPAGSERTFAREYRETLDLVRLAEQVGFDSAWVSEHHGSSDGYLPSLLTMLAAFAAVTERIKLGTGVVLTPLHDPVRLAEDSAVVDQLSDGRLILGLGLGWREEEFRMLGVPLDERLSREVETIEILRRAWTGKRFSFEGRSFSYDRIRITPPAAQTGGPPIYLGGYAEKAVRRAGLLAEGYITDGDDIETAKKHLAMVEEAAAGAGKDPAKAGLALLQNAFVQEAGDAWDTVRDGVTHQIGSYTGWEQGHDTPGHDSLEPTADEAEVRGWTPTGTPDEVAAALRPLVEEFGSREQFHVIVRLHYPGMDYETAARAVELFAREVIPALRSYH